MTNNKEERLRIDASLCILIFERSSIHRYCDVPLRLYTWNSSNEMVTLILLDHSSKIDRLLCLIRLIKVLYHISRLTPRIGLHYYLKYCDSPLSAANVCQNSNKWGNYCTQLSNFSFSIKFKFVDFPLGQHGRWVTLVAWTSAMLFVT